MHIPILIYKCICERGGWLGEIWTKTILTYREVDLETKLSSHNFFLKTNEKICFSILTTWISISSFKCFWVVRIKKQIASFVLWSSYGSTILFRVLLTFTQSFYYGSKVVMSKIQINSTPPFANFEHQEAFLLVVQFVIFKLLFYINLNKIFWPHSCM